MGDPVQYHRVIDDPHWRNGVDELDWQEKTVDGSLLWYSKDGECPHCRHPGGINVTVEAEGILGVRGSRTLGLDDVYVKCECSGDETRPQGVNNGCGYAGYVAGPAPKD